MSSFLLLVGTFLLSFYSFFSEVQGSVEKTQCSTDIFRIQPPQFQIISAAKTGSTSIYSYLCQHSSIQCLAKRKELNLLRNKLYRLNTSKVLSLEIICVMSSFCFSGEVQSFGMVFKRRFWS